MSQNLIELNAQIQDLLTKRKQLEIENFQKDLSWTKDCDLELEVCTLVGAGLPTYKIHIYGNSPYISTVVDIFNHGKYPNSVTYKKYDYETGYPVFCCNDLDVLLKFLGTINYKSLKFTPETRRIWQACKKFIEWEELRFM